MNISIRSPGNCPDEWIVRGLDYLYKSDLVPEQQNMPFVDALVEHLESTEYAYTAMVEDGDRFHLAIFEVNSTSHHISGCGLTVLSVVGNGCSYSSKLLFGSLKRFAVANGMKWINITHRTGKYTYQSKYYRLGAPNGKIN